MVVVGRGGARPHAEFAIGVDLRLVPKLFYLAYLVLQFE